MKKETLYPAAYGVASGILCSLVFSGFSFAASSNDFMLMEDTFSTTENSASSDDIISESILLPIQMLGEVDDIVERTHEISACGDGMREGSEVCDGNDFGSQTCSDYGYESGNLTCSSNCLAVSFGLCNSAPVSASSPAPVNPTPTPVFATATPSPVSAPISGNSSSGGGGRDILTLITPAPVAASDLKESAPEAEPSDSEVVASVQPEIVISVGETSDNSGGQSPHPTAFPLTEDDRTRFVEEESEALEMHDDSSSAGDNNHSNNNNNNAENDLHNEEVNKREDLLSDDNDDLWYGDISLESSRDASLIYTDDTSLHSSAEENIHTTQCDALKEEVIELRKQKSTYLDGLGNSFQGFIVSNGYAWIVLLIVFLLGMLTEYIISSVTLLFRRK